MKFDPHYTAAWYDRLGMGEWDRWDRSGPSRMQEAIFRHHLTNAVRRGDRVLDAGCGAGRFTQHLLELDAHVTAFDLSATQIELCRKRAPGADDYVIGSITDLSGFVDETFDTTVCIGGPLSYTLDRTGQAIAELVRVTRRGGRIVVSVMGLHGSLHAFLEGVLTMDPASNEHVLATGDLSRSANDGHEAHVYRVEELRELLSGAGIVDVELHAPGFLTAVHEDLELPQPGTPEFEFLMKAELAASRENPGGGTHIIGVGARGR